MHPETESRLLLQVPWMYMLNLCAHEPSVYSKLHKKENPWETNQKEIKQVKHGKESLDSRRTSLDTSFFYCIKDYQRVQVLHVGNQLDLSYQPQHHHCKPTIPWSCARGIPTCILCAIYEKFTTSNVQAHELATPALFRSTTDCSWSMTCWSANWE